MSILLPDESYCKTDLGLILYKDRKIYRFQADITDVIQPAGFFGHVDYNIVLKAIPQSSLNYKTREFTIVSRFKELSRLYTQLSTIHRQLYLKDTFPNFVEGKLFGSAAPETISERRRAIEVFLNFVLKSEVLCKARTFQTFLENAKEKKEGEELPANAQTTNSASENESSVIAEEAKPITEADDEPPRRNS